MSRFEFALDRVLKVRRQQERLAELQQKRARQNVEEAQAMVRKLQVDLTHLADGLTARVGHGITPQQWVAGAEFSERIGQAIRIAEEEVSKAEERYAAAAKERSKIAMEVEAMTTLRAEQWAKWQQDRHKSDQEGLDEIGMRKWMVEQAADEPVTNEGADS